MQQHAQEAFPWLTTRFTRRIRIVSPIVVAVDGSVTSYQAVAWAAVEARLRHCPLHIITSYAIPNGTTGRTAVSGDELAWLRRDGARVLTEAERTAETAARGDTLAITTEFTLELITPTLIARSKRARLLVVGNRGRGAIRRAVLGSVSSAVTRHAHCPVVVVHEVAETGSMSLAQPVVVGVDGTENSLPAVESAFQEASLRQVGVIAVHAWSDTTGYDLPAVDWNRIRDTEEALLSESLAGLGEKYPEVPVQRFVARDTPVRALLEHADRAQLLVVGSHGRGGFAGLLLGSTSTALLHLADCPVLVVRQD
ncbi:universal stress protein [Nocardia sp. NBC_01503]|uniref:universal stress protein n=1 Tax=Nocardia sp. NBC_01503 TaxID=2975997 RepID=UPI002E7BACD6|nr:universal stress protein [Nocardia sp. NBC_01503]WTL30703.1 universal stress protein [Nocardia sp. NBC_01503]